MALDDAGRDRVDLGAVADVAALPLAAELRGERASRPRAARGGRSASRARSSSRAIASPIPPDAPVTTAIRSAASTPGLTVTSTGIGSPL